MTETQRLQIDIKDAIATVRLNRPESHNGLDLAMFRALVAAAKSIRKDRSIRAVVLCGEGASFCAGLDFKAVQQQPSLPAKIFLKWPWSKTNLAQQVANCWRDLPVPVIAAVHGNCFGGGLQIALACDFRISTEDARWSVMEIRWGIIPDMSGTLALSKLTRYDTALELTMSGRIFDGREAQQYGLVSHLSAQPEQAAQTLARELIAHSPDALAASKLLFRKTWQANNWLALAWERWVQMRLLGRKNQLIAMKNGLSKSSKAFAQRSRWW